MITGFWLGLLRLLHAFLPISGLAWLGERLGGLLWWVARDRRRVALTNLLLCFPEKAETERLALARAHFRAFSRAMLLETIPWWGDADELERLVEVRGAEVLRQHAGRPIILLVPHFVGINTGGVRIIQMPVHLVNIYSPVKNPAIERLVANSRHRFGDILLYDRHAGVKPVIRALKQGHPFHYSPDLDYGRKDAIFIPFFGVPAATVTGLARIARATGAVVIPAITLWEHGRYVLRFHAAWDNFPSDDIEADTRRMNAYIEACVRDTPEQYFWVHRRFKTRPEGENGLYDA
jgi:KDO2-lipid IV(A) lauroyltransferase